MIELIYLSIGGMVIIPKASVWMTMIEDIYHSDVALYNNVFIDYSRNGYVYSAVFRVQTIDGLLFIVSTDYD